jgi:phosphoglucomutase
MALKPEILLKIKEWSNPPYDQNCIDEIKSLLNKGDEKELIERFGVELDFGTGGIRGIIGYGTNRMNIYTIAKTTQGLANYVLKNDIQDPKAAIAYDSRHYSKEFAIKAATILASNNIKTYIFKELRPTPELSYAIRYLKCTTGIVITASHNPKEYNGYKVYWNDGAQIVSPQDTGIIEEVRKIKDINQVKDHGFDTLLSKKMIEFIGEEIDEAFIKEVIKLSINKNKITGSDIKIVYTPLHGTGITLIPDTLKKLGLKEPIYVEEQILPDPEFSTVVFPNPEEKEALALAINKAKQIDADIVIATDPDADRMGLVVKDNTGEYKIITGNQIGAILEYYILKEKKALNILPENGAVIKTIVTTTLQDEIGKNFDVEVFNVLTGFKFIGEKIKHFENDANYTFLFATEESYGYLTGTHARDKDSISAASMIAECCAILKSQNKTIIDLLEEMYNKYGYYKDEGISKYFKGIEGKDTILKIMEYFRKNKIESFSGISVSETKDYKNQKIPDAKGSKYTLPESNVIQYFLDDGSKITLRPSGTEPKIKFYFSTKGKNKNEVEEKVKLLKDEFLKIIDNIVNNK